MVKREEEQYDFGLMGRLTIEDVLALVLEDGKDSYDRRTDGAKSKFGWMDGWIDGKGEEDGLFQLLKEYRCEKKLTEGDPNGSRIDREVLLRLNRFQASEATHYEPEFNKGG
ncbi:hypothetical protein BY996DRAFT_6504042 [Phakopsora pachyrhizi]|nr:hypothetical protein BY996DRAFT_6504042 [Phakopsora pachyrhizi]